MRYRTCMLAAMLAAVLFSSMPARSEDLLDYVIYAVDPKLVSARPLIECLAGGGDALHCASKAAKAQAPGVLPISPEDQHVKQIVAIFHAARSERWFDVVSIGGKEVAESVSCAMLPLPGALKSPACSVVGWVIAENVQILDQAWHALKGPDWWALVYLLGDAACQFIPGDGASGIAKDALCGPLAAAITEIKQWADTMAAGAVSAADKIENIVFGDDSHMSYDRYYMLYFAPWLHYSVARIHNGESLGPAIGNLKSYCVDYFDSHNQYKSTAEKTCGDLRARFEKEVKGFAAALPVAVDGYFETIARPAIRGAARASYGKPAGESVPGEDFFVSNCAFQMRQRFPFPEPDPQACKLLADKAKEYANEPIGALYVSMSGRCFGQVAQQTVNPSVWTMACDDMRHSYRQAFAGESLKLIAVIGQMKHRGCVVADPSKTNKLRIDCPTFAATAKCLDALGPDGEAWCAKQIVVVSEADQAGGAVAAADPSVLPPASGTVTRESPSDTARPSQPGLPPAARDAASSGRSTAAAPAPSGPIDVARAGPAVQRGVPLQVVLEGEQLAASAGAAQGRVTVQDMSGFGAGWSGNGQLFWTGGQTGAVMDLPIEVPEAGVWSVVLRLTRAPDYADLGFEVAGRRTPIGFTGYSTTVSHMDAPLGTFPLEAGNHIVAIMIVGRQAASTNHYVGVDRITLTRLADLP